MERRKNILIPIFPPPYVMSCENQGEDIVCLEEYGGNMSSRNDVYEHPDLNETPGWEGGRHESGNSKAWLELQREQLEAVYLWMGYLQTGQDHPASSVSIYPFGQETRGR